MTSSVAAYNRYFQFGLKCSVIFFVVGVNQQMASPKRFKSHISQLSIKASLIADKCRVEKLNIPRSTYQASVNVFDTNNTRTKTARIKVSGIPSHNGV